MELSQRRDEALRKMADLLRAGAAMLAERCPICGLPLFRLKSGEVVCPIHGRVYIVKDESEVSRVTVQGVLEELERVASSRIAAALESARRGEDTSEELSRWLDVLERAERILAMVRGSPAATAKRPGGSPGEQSGSGAG